MSSFESSIALDRGPAKWSGVRNITFVLIDDVWKAATQTWKKHNSLYILP